MLLVCLLMLSIMVAHNWTPRLEFSAGPRVNECIHWWTISPTAPSLLHGFPFFLKSIVRCYLPPLKTFPAKLWILNQLQTICSLHFFLIKYAFWAMKEAIAYPWMDYNHHSLKWSGIGSWLFCFIPPMGDFSVMHNLYQPYQLNWEAQIF